MKEKKISKLTNLTKHSPLILILNLFPEKKIIYLKNLINKIKKRSLTLI